MSTTDDIFLVASEPLETTVDWLSRTLQLEQLEDSELAEGEYLFRGRARTMDGVLVFVVEPNTYGEVDPEPEDVSAVDRYTGVLEVRLVGAKDEESQAQEARAIFDELAATKSDVALILSHAMSWIVAAYLPGSGAHTFPPRTSLDVEDIDAWRPWVIG
jgi:hypothetical protein